MTYYIQFFTSCCFIDRATYRLTTTSSSSSDVALLVDDQKWCVKNAYLLCYFSLALGVSLGRMSINYFSISKLWFIFLMQTLNLIGWGLEIKYSWIRGDSDRTFSVIGLCLFSHWLGWVGGFNYSNTMSSFWKHIGSSDSEKQEGISAGISMMNFSFCLAALTATIVSATILSDNNKNI
jgi:hypothetical protein